MNRTVNQLVIWSLTLGHTRELHISQFLPGTLAKMTALSKLKVSSWLFGSDYYLKWQLVRDSGHSEATGIDLMLPFSVSNTSLSPL